MRKLPNWMEFHREAGRRKLCFDRPVKDGKRYTCVAFTTKDAPAGGWLSYKLAEGAGKTPLESMEAAYRESGRTCEDLDRLWDKVCGRGAAVVAEDEDDFAALFD